ncbi:MAG: phytoene/squalene synthase family protein [Actinomycetales bacterium]|nr:phytoene/squalene synthase family protein [Actinomycetales bacterium]
MRSSQQPANALTGLELYTRAAERASAEVIDTYSTSFGMASKLLGKRVRQDVRNIYALVRIADEIVDGAAAQALSGESTAKTEADIKATEHLLDDLEIETYAAIDRGYSTNLVVHAFAMTAIRVGIGREIIEPFFTSMRMDLREHEHDQASFEEYVYGSAEVVGLMCLQAFVHERDYSAEETAKMIEGARALGSAFQKVNFLRDLAADFKLLGRSYFPGVTVESFDENSKREIVADIAHELHVSALSLPLLPADSRRAVVAAQLLFEALNKKLAKTPAEELASTRVSVSTAQKLRILALAQIGVMPR